MGIELHQYQADKTISRYIFKSGKIAVFLGGYYRTSIQSEIDELNAEIANGIGAIWVPAEGATINSDDLDPVAVMKRKIIAEYEAEKARSLNNGESFSDTSGSGKPVGSNAAGVNAVASNSSGAASVAKVITPGSINLGKK